MTPPLVLVAEHPARTTGFTRIAHNVADGLSRRGRDVLYVGMYSHTLSTDGKPNRYSVEAVSWVHDAAARVAAVATGRSGLVDCVFFGRVGEVERLANELVALGARRQVRLTYYVTIDFAPLPPVIGRLSAIVDRIIPATELSYEMIKDVPGVGEPIGAGVDTSVFSPGAAPDDGFRRERFGLSSGEFLIGTFSRNSSNKRLDLAARVVSAIAHGSVSRCSRCDRMLLPPLSLDGRPGARPQVCDRCGCEETERLDPLPVRWQLHCDDLDDQGRRQSGGWDIDMLIERYSLEDVIWWERDLPTGAGVPVEEFVERIRACDLHLLLSDWGGWELTMLETAACGVPNVIAEAGAFVEYATPFSVVVAVQDGFDYGHQGWADVRDAAAAVRGLLVDPQQRRRLGEAGVAVAARYDWARIVDRWDERFFASSGPRPER